jgi:hypothetical protein
MARTKQTSRKSTGGKALRSHHPRMGRSSALALVLALLSSLGHSRAQVGPDALNSIAATFTPPVTPAVASVDLGDQPVRGGRPLAARAEGATEEGEPSIESISCVPGTPQGWILRALRRCW